MPQIKRYNPNLKVGLTSKQVAQRIHEKLVNVDTTVTTKSIKSIILSNIFTIFNLLNFGLALAIFFVHSYRNLLFMGIVICNTLISTYQEIHSKKVIDKLAVVSATKTTVIRDKREEKIGINELVLDDIIKVNSGNQIITDCIIQEGEVEVNESFITGESDTIYKKTGDMLLSGSFIVSGKCIAKVEHIANDNFTAKISTEAKQMKKIKSEIMESLNKVIKTVSLFILPVGALLFYNQVTIMETSFEHAVTQTVAALIGMIPEGLILLTSTVLAVSVIRLSKSNVLVQELYCIETLARVDVLCLDKTGTITEGKMQINTILPMENKIEEIENALTAIGKYSDDNNVTIEAIRAKYNKTIQWNVKEKVGFSSQRKWSGICFEGEGSYILGAPELVIGKNINKYEGILNEYSKENRILVLAHSKEKFTNKELPTNITVCGFIMIQDTIRKEASKILEYFKNQGVTVKIISGDNPITVSNIAKRAGVENYDDYIDMSNVENKKITEIAKKYTIFGRVSPIQKRDLIRAIKDLGHTVAMTGDGVNDVLALKEADCSIAMSSGSDAARNISQLVLLDSNFNSMPKIVAEGRRTINNIERSSQLFLVKTIYSTLLAILFIFINMPFPFKPIQLSLLSVATIGIPSFVLALQPNKAMVKGRFLPNILSKSIPTALTVVCNILLVTLLSYIFKIDNQSYSTMCVILTAITGFMLLLKLCRPFNLLRLTLLLSMIMLFCAETILFGEIFYINRLSMPNVIILIIMLVISICTYALFNYMVDLILKKLKKLKKV